MNDKENVKLSIIANQLSSMSFILNSYCESFESIKEISMLIEFTEILHKKTQEIYELL